MSKIESAVSQLRANLSTDALATLLEAWRETPHPELARLIGALSETVRTPTPANVRGKTAASRLAWNEHAARATAADIPMLLESLVDVTSKDAAKRLPIVESWLPDPRIDAALVGVLEAVPYRATSTKPFWVRLFPLLAQITDRTQLSRIEALLFDHIAVTMGEWLRTKRAKLVEQLQKTFERDLAMPSGLVELASLIGGQQTAGAADLADIEGLYASVYDAPHDDGPRLVLADALIERNDPRGELISVQIKLAQDPDDGALRRREKELLEAHARGWLGDLAPIVMADVRFERGFLAACKIDNDKLDRVRHLVGHRAWSTVREIEGSALIALDPVMRSLRTLTFDQANARRHEGLPDAWRDLLVETPRPIEELRYRNLHSERQFLDTVEGRRQVAVSDQSEVDALATCAALPQLTRLTIQDNPVLYMHKLARAPVLERLAFLGLVYPRNNRFGNDRSPLADLAKLLVDARVPVLHVQVGNYHETLLDLERVGSSYVRARLTVGPTMKADWSSQLVDEAIAMLDALPKTVRELHVTTRRHTETQQVARLRAAATQLNIRCELSGQASSKDAAR